MMNSDVTFGEWLRRRRRGLDLTQQELAQRVGCAVSTLRKIEAGERRPSKELATQLATCLDIGPEEYDNFITFARAEPYLDQPAPPAAVARFLSSSSTPAVTAPLHPFLAQEISLQKPPSVFVARERELADLAAALETTQAGEGQILFVIGGAGRGKTMLVQEFARRAQAWDAELIVVSGYCNAHTGVGDPYLPFREALSMLAGEVEAKWAAGLVTSAHARRLWKLMPLTVPALVKQAPDLIGSFIPAEPLLERAASFAPTDAPWFKQLTIMTSSDQGVTLEQKRILAQYTALLKTLAAQRPLLLIVEDLHWVDTSSNDLLFHLSRQVGDSRILLVGTYRPEEVAWNRGEGRHPFSDVISELKRRHGDIWLDLGEQTPAEGRQFVAAYLDTQANRLDAAFREKLFQHTGGHALFTVELLREMQERGDLRQDEAGYWVEGEAIDWQTLPLKVEGVIERMINRLEEEMQIVLNIASVEGETFTAEVVARIQQLNERELVQQLSRELDKRHRLVTAQALAWLERQRLSLYRFRHHLFQHYLYHRLDETERAYLHEAVGEVLEALYGEQTELVAVQLARHFEQAGLTGKAVNYLLQAGKQASRLSANEEVIVHLTKGLELLKTLPDTTKRTQQELDFQIALGNALVAMKGYAAPEVGQTFNRAWELCQQMGETPQLIPVLHGLHRFYLVRAELQTARELGEQILRLAQRQSDSALLVSAHRVMGATLWFLGEFALAQAHLEQGLALYDPQQHPTYVLLYGQDEGVTCLAYLGWTLWFLGYPDQAIQRSHEAITLAQTLAHPFSLAYALSYAAWPHRFRQEAQLVQKWAAAAIALANEQGFALWLAMSTMHQGQALVEQGQGEEGMAQIRQGLAAWRETGAELAWHYFSGLLAEAHIKMGQVKEGLVVVDEALAAVPKSGRFWEAELYRLKGELLLKVREAGGRLNASREESPEAYFLKAIEIARRQEAKSLELRAIVSLGRLWQSQGKKEEACRMLAEIYGWFSEGFDTTDLKEAKVLLEELS
jgi:predicted ATPase/DNA-binding XRE family transcriptional regulator